jgi:COMPASS component SWD1
VNVALLNPFTSDHPEVLDSEVDNGGVATTCLAFNATGDYLACGGNDGRVLVWDCMTRSAARQLCNGHVQPITALSWSRDSRRLLSASVDWTVRIWLVAESRTLLTLRCQAQIAHAHLHPRDASFLVCPLLMPALFVTYDVAAAKSPPSGVPVTASVAQQRPLPLPAAVVNGRADLALPACVAVFSVRGDQIFAANRKGVVLVIDTQSLQVIRTVTVSSFSAVKSISLARSGKRVLLNCADKRIRMFALDRDWALEREFFDAVNRFQWRSACFSSNEDYVVGGSAHKSSHKLYIWSASGNLIKILEHEKSGVLSVAWHPHRVLLASASAAGPLLLWAAVQTEHWSAYAPNFTELEENVEYVEREDEFDIEDEADIERKRLEAQRLIQGDETQIIDIVGGDADAGFDAELDETFFLPTVPEPDPVDIKTDAKNRSLTAALTQSALERAVDAARRACPAALPQAKRSRVKAEESQTQTQTQTVVTQAVDER